MKIRGQRVIPLPERIKANSKLDDVTGCWVWTGSVRRSYSPYGRTTIGSRSDGTRRSTSVHRLSFETFTGPIPDGMCVCHKCDNPRCVNPDHLFLGTKKDNADDRDRKGRNSPPPRINRTNSPQAKLSHKDISDILKSSMSSRKITALYGLRSDSHIRTIRRSKLPAPPASEDET